MDREGKSEINKEHKREKIPKPLPRIPVTKLRCVNQQPIREMTALWLENATKIWGDFHDLKITFPYTKW